MTTKEIKNRTRTGRLNFSVTKAGNFLGQRMTANSVYELLTKCPKRWEFIEFRNDEGKRIAITREFIDEGGMTIDECIADWLEFSNESDFEEPILTMGNEFGITFKW